MAFVIKSLKPAKLRIDAIRLELLNELRREGRIQVKEYKKTVKTWKRKPTFGCLISLTRQDMSVVSAPKSGGKIWEYLDKGTRIRWAVMSGDWKSQTRPGKWSSSRGKGRAVIWGRRAMQKRNIRARPGIKARGWTEDLSKRRRRPFQRNVFRAVKRGADKLYP